jgi:hypothetical protein
MRTKTNNYESGSWRLWVRIRIREAGTLLEGDCTVGTSDFNAQMSGIKLWKDNEYLRPVNKKTFFETLSSCFYEIKTSFSLNISNGVSKNLFLYQF